MIAKLLRYSLAATAVGLAAQGAVAATTINVQLTDTGLDHPMATGLAYKTPGANTAKATAMIKLSQATAAAGPVTFNVKNTSKDLVHEMLVVPMADAGKPLPYVASDMTVDEEKIKSLGEVSELDPGKAGTLTVNLKPGTYVLLCNVAGHFDAGMWATFTVK
jgi:uncharacterized cupredoxin-like copper-binding protein